MTKPLVELIVHCYAEEIPDFAKMLTAQLSSLLIWRPRECEVLVSVCHAAGDSLTLQVLDGFERQGVNLKRLPQGKGNLFRRAIGRNVLARLSRADVVWFIDSDYLLGEGCLDALVAARRKGFPHQLVFPRKVRIHKSHRLGDEEIARIVPGELFRPNLDLFTMRAEKMAIGGLQIVSGDTARAFGYCDQTSWVNPVSEEGGFRNTTEDKIYRSLLGGSMPIDVPGVYRMRHSQSAFEDAGKRLAQTDGVA